MIAEKQGAIEFLLGKDNVERCIGEIIQKAALDGLKRAFQTAADNLSGMLWPFEGVRDPRTKIRIMNARFYLLTLVANQKLRRDFCRRYKAKEGTCQTS